MSVLACLTSATTCMIGGFADFMTLVIDLFSM
jgi:hypothetical protein